MISRAPPSQPGASQTQLTRHHSILFSREQNDDHYCVIDKTEEDKESEELDLTGLDDTELDKVNNFIDLRSLLSSSYKLKVFIYKFIMF